MKPDCSFDASDTKMLSLKDSAKGFEHCNNSVTKTQYPESANVISGLEEYLNISDQVKNGPVNEDHLTTVPGKPEEEEKTCGENGTVSTGSKTKSRVSKAQATEDAVPDGGWGWIVVAAASFVLMSVDTIGQCFGIIFSSFLLERGASSLTTAWMINMFAFFFCLTGLPLVPLIQEFGWRRIAFVASLMLSVATVSSAFANSVWILFVSYSLLAGVSCGMLLTVSFTIIPHYFSKRRGLASGIIMALDSSGQIVAPPLVKWLQDEYTYKGATLILGGIVLNCCVASAVFHPVKWHLKPGTLKSQRSTNRVKAVGSQSERDRTEATENSQSVIKRLLVSMLSSLRMLRSPRAIIIAFGTTFFLCGYQNFMAFMPFVVQDAGYSLADAANCVSVSAICNMLTRLTVASLTDYPWFSYRVSILFSCTALTSTLTAFSLVRNLKWMIALMIFYGLGVGSYMCLFNLVMVHYFGMDSLLSMMGATMLITSLNNITVGPIAGLVRDLTGSYAACIWVLAALSFCSFLLWLLMPLAVQYDQKKDHKSEC